MGEILPFTGVPRHPLPPAMVAPPRAIAAVPATPTINVHDRRFMTTAELARRLGLDIHARRTIVGKLRILHRQRGLPLPRNPRIVSGDVMAGADAIYWGSLWDRGEALAWLDHGDTPPAGAGAPIPASRQGHIRGVLADRAAALLPARRVSASA